MDNKYGTLYICATPIGNLGDITLRALDALKNAEYIAAEDTRRTLKLLNHYGIKKRLISCHEHNEKSRSAELISYLKEGFDIALVSDAGMPAVSDPGGRIISDCVREGICVTVCPGASASLTALVLSGIKAERFTFEGFLPKGNKERRQALEALKAEKRTIIIYESPHRLVKTLHELCEYLGDRQIAVARELTKAHEEVFRASVSEAARYFEERGIKGEFVLVIEGCKEEKRSGLCLDEAFILESVGRYINQGLTEMDAIKKTAKDNGVSKRKIYEAVKCKTL